VLTAWRSARRDCDSAQARLAAAREQRRAEIAALRRRFRESFGGSGALVWSFNAGMLAGLKPRGRPPADGPKPRLSLRSLLKTLLNSLPLLVSVAGSTSARTAPRPGRGTDHASSEAGAPEASVTTGPPYLQEDAT
jgi:hypothetical protein